VIRASAVHAAALAAIHAEAFPAGERWDAAFLAGLLGSPGVVGFLDERGGFVLARAVEGEAEILTLAVVPAMRRQGIARRLLAAVIAGGEGPIFLEVAAANGAALALYAGLGWREVGRRPGYYGPGRDALLLRRG
jgi:ribosomal-protein-alanine N-acetyltransferase